MVAMISPSIPCKPSSTASRMHSPIWGAPTPRAGGDLVYSGVIARVTVIPGCGSGGVEAGPHAAELGAFSKLAP